MSWIHCLFVRASCTVLDFLTFALASLQSSGAIKQGESQPSHLSSQNRVRLPSPMEALNIDLTSGSLPNSTSMFFHGRSASVRLSHVHLRRTAYAARRRSMVPRPPN